MSEPDSKVEDLGRPGRPNDAEPKVVMKGSRTVRHDLFKLMPARMTKNNGWKSKQPIIVHHEHTHIFHSKNEKTGKANQYCSPAGGHFHEIITDWSRKVTKKVVIEGEPQEFEGPHITCGPALCIKRSTGADGTDVKEIVPPSIAIDGRLPQFKAMVNEGQGADAFMVDRHKHEVIYLQSEYFTVGERDEFRKKQYNEVRNAMEGPGSSQVAHAARLQANAAIGKQIADGKGTPPPKVETKE